MAKKCTDSELLIRVDERVRVIQRDLSEIKNKYSTHIQDDIKSFKSIDEKLDVLYEHNRRIRTLEKRGVGYRIGGWVNGFISGVLRK